MEEIGMDQSSSNIIAFNSPLETGLRSLCILSSAHPNSFDLQQLIAFDHLAVHTGDIEGAPVSLHPKDSKRNGELLVRRQIVERGLLLMESKKLLQKIATPDGFHYKAGEFASVFLESLTTPYMRALLIRADWIVNSFLSESSEAFSTVYENAFERWATEFQFTKLTYGANQQGTSS